jgi:hypothetical protein
MNLIKNHNRLQPELDSSILSILLTCLKLINKLINETNKL